MKNWKQEVKWVFFTDFIKNWSSHKGHYIVYESESHSSHVYWLLQLHEL